jgi:heptaprenyl diphosphate synthase
VSWLPGRCTVVHAALRGGQGGPAPPSSLADPALPEAANDALRRVRGRLEEIAGDVHVAGWDLRRYLTGGKLLRARLAILAASLADEAANERAERYAVAVELIHAGALCHDDVVDRSATRRGEPTVEQVRGTRTALHVGLWLMVRAAHALADEPVAVGRAVARAIRDVARGQTDELRDLFDGGLSPAAYLRRVYLKTGALYELTAWLGATAGGLDPRSLTAVAGFGADVGVAFQLTDDLRDLLGAAGPGRPAGLDLREGVYTLPVLLTLSGHHPGSDAVQTMFAANEPAWLPRCVAVLEGNGALAATRSLAAVLLERAVTTLSTLPPSGARTALEALAHEVIGDAGLRPDSFPGLDAAPHVRLRPIPSLLRPADDPTLLPRFEALVDAAWRRLPRNEVAWVEHASLATLVAVTLAEICLAAPDRPPDAAPGREWAANASATTAVDLVTADLFGVLPALPPRFAAAVCDRLAALLSTRLTGGPEEGAKRLALDLGEAARCELAAAGGRERHP